LARRAIVVGAGVAGLCAAWRLGAAGWQVELKERSGVAGGLAAARPVDGVACDLGAHRLHRAALAVAAVRELAAEAPLCERPRRGRIIIGGRHLPYPLSVPALVGALGVRRGARFALGFVRAPRWRDLGEGDAGFEQFVVARVGRAAYEAFYLPYARKVWGLDPAELSQSCAKQRVSTAAPWRALAGGAETYLVPTGGFDAWIAALVARAVRAGARLTLGAADGDADADAVVFTGHLGARAQAPELGHRGLALAWLRTDARLGATDTWYCPDADLPFGRVSHVGRFTAAPGAEGLLCVEVPQGAGPPDPALDPASLGEALASAGILPRGAAVTGVGRAWLPAVYPLYRRGWRASWRRAVDAVCGDGRTWPAGRQGLWLHCNLDHAMATAEAAAAAIVRGDAAARWPDQAARFLDWRVRD